MCILLVDDHVDTTRLLKRLFKLHGRDVATAAGVEEAMRLAAEVRCAVVVADIDLPDGSGLDVMREAKRLHGMRGVAVTGHTGDEIERQCREAGFDKFLAKPTKFETLLAAVEELAADGAG